MEILITILLALALLLLISNLVFDIVSKIILHKLEVKFLKDIKKEGK